MNYYPLKLKSVTKNIIWGGKRLSEEFGKGSAGEKIAEAWTLAFWDEDVSVILNGDYKGMNLKEYISLCSMESVTGKSTAEFPFLVKLIDACEKLSVQVHPDDLYAHAHGLNAGKTEMWYIIDAKPGARLVYGLNKGITFSPEEFKAAAEAGKLEKYLNFVEVKKGDVFFIPAGLVHAIGEGILIAEIQQNSNTTYRIYDYNRTDNNGNKRELHIDKALEAINPSLPDGSEKTGASCDGQHRILAKCDFFTAGLLTLSKNDGYGFDGGKMMHLVCLDGKARILFGTGEYKMSKGDAYLIPAKMGYFTVFSESGAEIFTAG